MIECYQKIHSIQGALANDILTILDMGGDANLGYIRQKIHNAYVEIKSYLLKAEAELKSIQ